jgi:hypothetical protein
LIQRGRHNCHQRRFDHDGAVMNTLSPSFIPGDLVHSILSSPIGRAAHFSKLSGAHTKGIVGSHHYGIYTLFALAPCFVE